MIIRLRPHHLLCMLTFSGKGYNPSFSANFKRIVGRLSDGARIILVSGPDDICQPMLSGNARHHCHEQSIRDRDAKALEDISRLTGEDICTGEPFSFSAQMINALRDGFQTGGIRNACVGCEWFDLCTTIAADDFRIALLLRPGKAEPR